MLVMRLNYQENIDLKALNFVLRASSGYGGDIHDTERLAEQDLDSDHTLHCNA